MENTIKLIEKEIKQLQDLIKSNMTACGDYPNKLEQLIGEHINAISILKENEHKEFNAFKTKNLTGTIDLTNLNLTSVNLQRGLMNGNVGNMASTAIYH